MTTQGLTDAGATAPSTGDRAGHHRRRSVVALALALVVAAALVLAAVAATRSDQAEATASLLQDQAVTKTYQELDRQARLPAAQRSIEALAWAVATPQSDTTGATSTTEVLRGNLSGATLTAHVASAVVPGPGEAASSYLEVLVRVTVAEAANVSNDISTCVVRSGSAGSPIATGPYAVTSHLSLPPCDPDVLRGAGIS